MPLGPDAGTGDRRWVGEEEMTCVLAENRDLEKGEPGGGPRLREEMMWKK